MDANKLKVLQKIGYKVLACCGLCKHADFASPASHWGTCSHHHYEHLKHSESKRELSINRHGGCFDFEKADSAPTLLGGFSDLDDHEHKSVGKTHQCKCGVFLK